MPVVAGRLVNNTADDIKVKQAWKTNLTLFGFIQHMTSTLRLSLKSVSIDGTLGVWNGARWNWITPEKWFSFLTWIGEQAAFGKKFDEDRQTFYWCHRSTKWLRTWQKVSELCCWFIGGIRKQNLISTVGIHGRI